MHAGTWEAQPVFSRVAIVNRGEAAMRLIHAVRDLSAETGTRIETVALYTDADRHATFVREADVAYPLGPASARPYLDHAVLERALVQTGADAAWVGWGFVAEDPAFAELCDKLGVTFVGPSPEAMRKLGDKIGSKLVAEEVGVPVAPWSRGAVATLADALRAGEEIGYPLMLKATAGGGGRGIRMVASAGDLIDAYERTSQEALRAFGSGVVFLERLVTGARHVEVQVIADGQGTAWALGVRDCSVQRRNQKIIEESASPVLSPGGIAGLQGPTGPGIRVDTGVSEGAPTPADFDSMIAKIIAYGSDRDQALARLRRAMRETTVIIEGGVTNKSFVLDLLDQPEVIDATADTGWIDRVRAEGRLVSHQHSAVALAAAAIEAYQDEEEVALAHLLATAHVGRPQVQHESGRLLDLKQRGVRDQVTVARVVPNHYRD